MSTTVQNPPPQPKPTSERLVSLDQFRGYTVVGMLLVNFLGSFAACPRVLRHTHDYLSYADTIMPQFFFAVGFAMRLTFGRRIQRQGSVAAYGQMAWRILGLVLLSLIIYHPGSRAESWSWLTEIGFWGVIQEPLKRSWFQTLMHIAVTSLWILPVVGRSIGVRTLWMVASAAAHVFLSDRFNFVWVNSSPNGIDGGPLGFLTWTIPTMVGTFACDAIVAAAGRARWVSLVAVALLLMGVGYLVSCGTRYYDVPESQIASLQGQKLAVDPVFPPRDQLEEHLRGKPVEALLAEPPFVPPPDATHRKWNYWMMSQRAGTLSYLTFSAGFSLAVYLLFYVVADVVGWQLSFFRTFGTNALLAYVIHDLISESLKPFIPKDSPGWYVTAGVAAFFIINWLVVRHFEKRGINIRM
jgi:predicted acyltransferase